MSSIMSLWMTESSLIDWEDTIALDVHLPAGRWPQFLRASLGDGLDLRYEGLVDNEVPVGGVSLAGRGSGLHVEADWVLVFDQPLRSMQDVTPETPCVLQGMAEGQWLEPLAREDSVRWAEVTHGNNLLARGRGIPTTLGAIQRQEHAVAACRLILHLPLANGESRTRIIEGSLLADLPLLAIARGVQDFARQHPERAGETRAISLGVTGEAHAYMQEADPRLVLPASAYLPRLFHHLLSESGRLGDLLDRMRREVHLDLLARGDYLRPGTPLLLSVLDCHGAPVGEGALVLQEAEEPKAGTA